MGNKMNYMNRVISYMNILVGKSVANNKQKRIIRITGIGSNNMSNRILLFIYFIFTLVMHILLLFPSLISDYIPNDSINLCSVFFNIPIFSLKGWLLRTLVLLITYIILYIKLKGYYKAKKTNLNIYQRDLPSNLRPAHVRMLVNDGEIDSISLASTILDLINRGYLGIKDNGVKFSDNSIIFMDKTNNYIIFKKNTDYSQLFEYEKFVIKWLIDDCGNKEEIKSKELHLKLKEINSSENFELFQAYVLVSFPIERYYIKKSYNNNMINIIGVLGGFVLNFFTLIGVGIFAYFFGISLFGYPPYVLNDIGYNEKDEWLDLKKFLEDFSLIEEKPVNMIKIWDFYLTYAVALELASIAIDELKDFFGENIYYTNNPNGELEYFDENGNKMDVNNIKDLKTSQQPKNKNLYNEVINDMNAAKKLYKDLGL